ncbi:MAG: sulfatase-like hydrolase/transferase [Planctomycetes bacterium]|nr:sulfatase-like hydrolase/transferase [Planctomycetota bacterium]
MTHVVLILADDLGCGELSVQGCADVRTPNIDSSARGGVRFTSGYVTCPVCAPTRAGLLMGRCPQRFGATRASLFKALDQDGDGRVTRDEVEEWSDEEGDLSEPPLRGS